MKERVVFSALDIRVSQSLEMYGDGSIRAGLQRRLEGRQEPAEVLSVGRGLIKKENR